MAQRLAHDWYPVPLSENVAIGARSWLYSSFSCLHLESRLPQAVRIGDDSGVYAGCFFDLGEQGSVTIGNHCTIVGAIISANGPVVIEDFAFIAHDVVIADGAFAVPPGGRTSTTPSKAGELRIGRNVWIGARAVILSGAQIGEGSIIGAGTVVAEPVPEFSIYAGQPGKVVGAVPRGAGPLP